MASLACTDIADFLDPSEELKKDCLRALCDVFASTVSMSNRELQIGSLHIDGFGLEDIWEQLELVNKPLLADVSVHMKEYKRRPMEDLINLKVNNESVNEDDSNKENVINGEDLINEDVVDEESDINDELEDELSDNLENNIDTTTEDTKDRFFNLAEMYEFLNRSERQNNLDDGINLFTEDAGEEIDEDDEMDQEESNDKIFYDDFFDPLSYDNDIESLSEEDVGDMNLSTHQKKQKKMESYISKLEESNIDEKTWQMRGEVSSKERYQNTALEEDLQFDHVRQPVPEITEEVTIKLEDIIKQRIKDKMWDDVIRKFKPKEQSFNFKVVPSLNEEKSKLSLAEVYEQEYIKQTQAEKLIEENPKHKEIKSLIDKLFNQLDSLSNYHFVPIIPEPEIKTVPMLPSLTFEEVAPIIHSNDTLQAPEEIHSPSKHSLVAKSEMSKTDKLRERRHKKKIQKLKGLQKQRKEKITKKENQKSNGGSKDFFARLDEKIKSNLKEEL